MIANAEGSDMIGNQDHASWIKEVQRRSYSPGAAEQGRGPADRIGELRADVEEAERKVRMYWAKRLTAMTPNPRTGWATACYLIGRLSLGGRDPSTYGNLAWA